MSLLGFTLQRTGSVNVIVRCSHTKTNNTLIRHGSVFFFDRIWLSHDRVATGLFILGRL